MDEKTLELLELTSRFRAGGLTEVQYEFKLHRLNATKEIAEVAYEEAKAKYKRFVLSVMLFLSAIVWIIIRVLS